MSYLHKNTGKLEANVFLTLIANYAATSHEDNVGYVCLDFEMQNQTIKNVYVYSKGYSQYEPYHLRKLIKSDWKTCGDNICLLGYHANETPHVRHVPYLASDH